MFETMKPTNPTPTNPTPTAASSSFTPAHTPPNSPRLPPSSRTVTIDEMKNLFLEVLQEVRASPAPAATTEHEAATDVQPEAPKARASLLEFKEVNEVFVSSGFKLGRAKPIFTAGMKKHINTKSSSL